MLVRLLIADDHRVVRQGLRMFLRSDPEIQIVGEARDGEEAVNLTRELKPEVVLMDLLMPRMDGIAATAAIRRDTPETEVIAMTSVIEDSAVAGAMAAGAINYILKDTRAHELSRVIKAAGAGQVALSAEAKERLMREVSTPEAQLDRLSQEDLALLRMLARGLSNDDMGRALGVGEAVVQARVNALLSTLGLASRTQAVLCARRAGMIPDSEWLI
jgi:two-component system, NarL family, response regulator LiaR